MKKNLMKHHKSVHAIIFFKGKYFIQKRDNKKNIHFPNFWGLFGGKIMKNELKIDAIIREIKEETNLKINKPKKILSFIIHGKNLGLTRNITYFVFNLNKIPKNIKIFEGSNFRFAKFANIKKLKFNPFDFAALCFHYYNDVKKEILIPSKYLKN
tara:strand:- start:418 stop:882 length:465 start_codon:yes stop_codon:yes gene_type:complete